MNKSKKRKRSANTDEEPNQETEHKTRVDIEEPSTPDKINQNLNACQTQLLDESPVKKKKNTIKLECSELADLFTHLPSKAQLPQPQLNNESLKSEEAATAPPPIFSKANAELPCQSLEDGDSEKKITRPFRRNKEKDKQTIFVGNVPITTTKNDIKQYFKQYGAIESIRFRSAAPANPKMPKKGVLCTKTFHKDQQSINAYVVFESIDFAEAATTANGCSFDGLTITVDIAGGGKKHDHKKSAFVGNLPFDVQEEAIRKHFSVCGVIKNVRVVRDRKIGMGKGFGYILFASKEAVDLALKLDGEEFAGRKLRISRSSENSGKPASDTMKSLERINTAPKKLKKPPPSNIPKKDFQGVRAHQQKKFNKRKKIKKVALSNKGSATKANDAVKPKSTKKKEHSSTRAKTWKATGIGANSKQSGRNRDKR